MHTSRTLGNIELSRLLADVFELYINDDGKIESPDFYELNATSLGKNVIPVEEVRNFVTQSKYKSFAGKRQIFVISEAEKMEDESQNTLLKTLEEPNSDNLFILITSNPEYLLPTIKSRCIYIYFKTEGEKTNDEIPKLVTDFTDLLFGARSDRDATTKLFELAEQFAKIDDSTEKRKHLESLFDIIFQELRSKEEFDKLEAVLKYEKYWKANVNIKLLLQNLVIALTK